jgi:putative NADPH-quinone reductase
MILHFALDCEESFTKTILNSIYNNLPESHYDIKTTDLTDSTTAEYLLNKERKFLSSEFEKLKECSYFLIIFPFIVSGIPGLVKEWFDRILETQNDLLNQVNEVKPKNLRIHDKSRKASDMNGRSLFKEKRGMIITYTDFPKEAFQPNSLHQSTIKRRLHYFNWVTLKYVGIEPCEPLVFYSNANVGFNQNLLSHKSTFESNHFKKCNTNKTNTVLGQPSANASIHVESSNMIGNVNEKLKVETGEINDKDSKSQGTKFSPPARSKYYKHKAREDFLNELIRSVISIDNIPIIDLTDI